MPLLRNLKMRLFDNYVGHNLTSIVRNDYQSQFDLTGVSFPATQVSVPVPNGYVFDLEDEDCVVGLQEISDDGIYEVAGHVYDFARSQQALAVFFDDTWLSDGYYKDEDNDDLLTPSDSGEFTISFWINPWSAPSGVYDVISKKIASASSHRFRVYLDSTGADPKMTFVAASADGTSEESVSAEIVRSRWSLVIARCKRNKLTLHVLGADGFVSKEPKTTSVSMGCQSLGDALYLGIGSDGVSNPLHAGSFYLQQVLFWDKLLTDSEEIELFSLGRGKVRFSDSAVPETFIGTGKYGSVDGQSSGWQVDLDSSGKVTKVYENSFVSPYIPCKTCDSEPFCYPNAIADPSPDEISLSVSWSATSTGCVPDETTFTMTRQPRQIIQGFIFGRTFESEKIALPCGGYIRFFLESTPRHWSQYRYRQYLVVETNYGGGVRFSKFNVTMGSALVRNSVTAGSNKFTSPSTGPTPTSFDFPFADSFSDYASDIVSAGWTDYATVLLEESFSGDGCPQNTIDAACVLADGYIFGFGEDFPEVRQGYYGWQMGIAETISGGATAATQDSMYNYKVTCGSPSSSHNTRVDPGIALLNRPFTALARGEIGCHDADGLIVDSDLPFDGFSAVLSPVAFVRPLPFNNFSSGSLRQSGPGGCIDCQVSSTFDSDVTPSVGAFLTPVSTRIITTSKCPQKTLSGTTSSVLSGASGRDNPAGSGLLAALGAPGQQATLISDRARFRDAQSGNNWLNHLGGTLRANGDIQFTSQVNDYDGASEDDPYLIVDTKSDDKIDPNVVGTHVSKIKKGTRVLPWIKDATTLLNETPTTESQVRRASPDRGSSSGSASRFTPVAGTQEISVSNCVDCNRPGFCRSGFTASLEVISYLPGAVASGSGLGPCSSSCVTVGTFTGPYGGQIDAGGNVNNAGFLISQSSLDPSPSIPLSLDLGEWVVENFNECPETIVEELRTATKESSPTPFLLINSGVVPPSSTIDYLSRPLVYGYQSVDLCEDASCVTFVTFSQDCESECNDYQSYCFASFGDIDFYFDVDTGERTVTVEYSVTYVERTVFRYFYQLYESYDYESTWVIVDPMTFMITSQGTESIAYGETYVSSGTGVYGASYSKRENRIATYRGPSPACVDGEVESVTLDFISDEIVSEVSTPATPFSPGGTEISAGVFEIFSESTRPICSMIDPAESIPPPYDKPEFAGMVSVSSCGIFIHPSVGNFPGCSVSSQFHVHSRRIVTVTGNTAASENPETLTVPSLVNLSASAIQISYSDPTFGLSRSVGYDTEYMVGDDVYEEDDWARWVFSDSDYRRVIFPSAAMYEVWLLDSGGHLDRIVARYRIPGFPISRWKNGEDNHLQLVSADWSLEDWPIYITVSPV